MDPSATPAPSTAAQLTPDPQTIWATIDGMIDGFLARVPFIVAAIVVCAIFYFVGKGVRMLVRRLAERTRRNRSLGLVFGRLAQWVIWFVGLLIAAVIAVPNFTPGQLVQLLGISGVAIGFAFRDILQNFLAGILILLTEPFRIGDQIVFGSYEGTVDDIQTRATYLTTYDGRRVVIPHAELFINSVTVNTAFSTRRIECEIGIGYGDDIAAAKQIVLARLRDLPDVLADPAPDVLVVDLAASSVTLRVRWWIKPPQRADALITQDAVLVAVKRALLAHGVDLPFPTQQILFHDQTEATDGDRARQREGWPAGNAEAPPARSIAEAPPARSIAGALQGLSIQRDERSNAGSSNSRNGQPAE